MALQNSALDARNNEWQGFLDQITNGTVTDARTISATLGALNAECTVDLNGHSTLLIDARTAAASLTFVVEGQADGSNYTTGSMNFYDTTALTTVVTSVVITTTLAKMYYVSVAGLRRVRVRVSAYTSGNVAISLRASMADFAGTQAGAIAVGPTVIPGTGATNLGKQRTAVIGATDTGVEMLARAVTSATAVTNTQLDVPQLEAATGAMFVNSPTAATAILKARAAAPGAADAGIEVLFEALTANTAVTTAQYHRPQLEANSGALFVRDTPSTVNGLTISHLITAATTNATSVKASAGNVYGWQITNKSAGILYVKLYNKASAPTVGTDVPVITIGIPTLSTSVVSYEKGLSFATGIAMATTGLITDADATAVALSDMAISLFYK